MVQYEGDAEQMSSRKATPVGNPLRATVDGDARRLRRRSSDESPGGGSVTELDPSNYLGAYQKSTPMQPGVCVWCGAYGVWGVCVWCGAYGVWGVWCVV